MGRRTAAVLAGALLCAMAAACKPSPRAAAGPAPAVSEVDALYASCMDTMVKNTCQVMNDKSSVAVADPGSVVFVAGVGPVDASSYQALRDSGDAMCSQMRKACENDWTGARCHTARSLWGAMARAPMAPVIPAEARSAR